MEFSALKRYPIRKNELFQAWDSADELLLDHVLNGAEVGLSSERILILNDQFGALSKGLEKFQITTYVDSFISANAIHHNTDQAVVPIHDLQSLSGIYQKVILKLPKNLSFLEDELCRVSEYLDENSQVIVGAMVKHLPNGAFDLLEKIIGPTTTSLAKKKARLIFAKFQKSKTKSPYPLSVKVDSFPIPFVNHSNLFSREKLDQGTRFFLEHIPAGKFETILDLGCANGIIGIAAKLKNSEARIVFSDDSAMAILSAKANFQAYFPGLSESSAHSVAEYKWTNCYENQNPDSVGLVLCNPPFHQQMVVGDFIAKQMFEDSFGVLQSGGVLRVIGNSHLFYGNQLKKIFGNSQKIAANGKFSIFDAVKRS